MKIEKVNDNQIRCILTKEDLEARHMRLSELAYGTDKARSLFQEMMRFAYDQYGFDINNFPLMIEAVPLSSDAILLIVTKVEYPDELDSRFANYSDTADHDDYTFHDDFESSYSYHRKDPVYQSDANDILSQYHAHEKDTQTIHRCYKLPTMDDVLRVASLIHPYFTGSSSLYRDAAGQYHFILYMDQQTASDFNKICNIMTEYALPVDLKKQSLAQLKEHGTCIIKEQAISILSQI